jgi:outer membrane protein OmpA-like peptidoglycan-associated protein
MIFSLRGDGLDAQSGHPEAGGISATGLGDLRLEAVWRFFDAGPISLAAIPAFTLPTGMAFSSNKDVFIGEKAPTFRPRVAVTLTALQGKLSAGANLGLILRKPRTLYSSQVGQQITYGAAAAYHVLDRLDVLAEVFGRKGFDGNLDDSPLEADGGLRVMPGGQLAILVGVGTGLVRGVGVPSFRLFASVTWSPDYRDSDGDGVPNQEDKCPDQPEDRDGFQDADGCPDPDNDGDFIEDAQDKCPNDKEDIDGFEDDDGCPDLDNDKDGIPDDKDACPNEPEDKLPPRPDDGCPVRAAEPDEAAKPQVVPTPPATASTPTSPVLSQKLEFDGTRIRTAARAIVEQTAAMMKSRTDVKKWKVTVAVAKGKFDKVQERLAQSQAAAVKAVLARKGIPANAIEVIGIVADAPMVTIAPTEGAATEEPVIEIEPN